MGAANVKLLQGVKTMSKSIGKSLQETIEANEKAEAIKIINEVSNLLADNSDYEDYLKPKLEKLLKYVNQ